MCGFRTKICAQLKRIQAGGETLAVGVACFSPQHLLGTRSRLEPAVSRVPGSPARSDPQPAVSSPLGRRSGPSAQTAWWCPACGRPPSVPAEPPPPAHTGRTAVVMGKYFISGKDIQTRDKNVVFLCGGNWLFVFGEVSLRKVTESWSRGVSPCSPGRRSRGWGGPSCHVSSHFWGQNDHV